MPIRKRGDSWQADVVTASGQRLRKSFPTKKAARDYTLAQTPPKPQPSGGLPSPMPSVGSQPKRRPITTGRPQEPLSPPVEPRTHASSLPLMSQEPANGGLISRPAPASGTQPTPATASPSSELPSVHGKASRTSKAPHLAKSPSLPKRSSERSNKLTPGRRSASLLAGMQPCEVEPSSNSPSPTSPQTGRYRRKRKTGAGSQCQSPSA
jgi:hypothetical protein